VRAPDYDRSAGFVQAYRVERPVLARSVSARGRINGIGACMAVRRSTFRLLHGFDERFGAGAAFRAAEDADLIVRSLIAGHWVQETDRVAVTHHGFRSWREGPPAIESYMFGLGAAYAKMIRIGGLGAVAPVATLAWRWLARQPAADLNHRPPRFTRLLAFVRGGFAGLRTPIDRASGRFQRQA
jgi:hypothetical protein